MLQGSENVLSVNPARNASGYKISYESNGKQIEQLVNRSEVEYIKLQNTEKQEVKNIQIKALP
ncbi:MAG: hypothetical protein WCP85_30145 [Mariniphaga sp.]